jgi:predicted dehydrogenase
MNHRIPRRRFLQQMAVAGAGFTLLKSPASVRSAQANNKLNIALVGIGGRGAWFTGHIPALGENLVALCDVDDTKNPEAQQRHPKAKRFRDFRRMLDDMGDRIDAVIVATPDHTHAVASAAAMRAGKHVFCEKPLTRTVHESRALRELARKHKVATSMGNQGTAAGPFRRGLELIRDGALGQIKEVHVWNSGGGADRQETPRDGGPAPDFLDWDLWLGPAAIRPYNRQWMQRQLWREFGTGQLGNWGTHSANLAFMALNVQDLWLSPPASASQRLIRIEAKHSGVNRLSCPKWELVKWTIPSRGDLPPITFTWHNGAGAGSRELLENHCQEELDWGDKKEKRWVDHGGAVIVGTEGSIRATEHNASIRLVPKDRFEEIQVRRPERVEVSHGHEQDWLRACRGGAPAWANFDYASALNEFLMLGNIATQFETALEFDPVAMKIVNDPSADALVRAESRDGWGL